jgi:hypothetical protein
VLLFAVCCLLFAALATDPRASLPELVDYYCEHPVTTDSQGKKLKLLKP